MISYCQFKEIVTNELGRDIHSNENQNIAISSKKSESLFIVAGPGSGKTTVMVLKILKFIFVDDVPPNDILATTFTKKAAKELHSRILEWGDKIKGCLLKSKSKCDFGVDDEQKAKIRRIDFNQIITGTIDSIAEELLKVYRDPGTNLPVVIEEFVANFVMTNSGLFNDGRYMNQDLREYLGKLKGKEEIKNPSRMSEVLLEIKNRIYYDQVDIESLTKNDKSKGAIEAFNAIKDYIEELNEKNIIDFPMLESRFLKRLKTGKLDEFLSELQIILVDEYQDTNLMQESIYFTLAKSAIENGGNMTVVGDDDQSLYRFRGATVDLFTKFPKRVKKHLDIQVKEVNLLDNYRSSENIINLCNHFVEVDDSYQMARVREKPKIKYSRGKVGVKAEENGGNDNGISGDEQNGIAMMKDKNIPIIGMFRKNQEVLARELAIVIKKLLNGEEVKLKVKKVLKNNEKIADFKKFKKHQENIVLKLDEKEGSPSDIAILTYSPKEVSYGNQLFPHHLRKNLGKFKNPIEVFNPRGQDLQTIDSVAIFCGLMLECIDPNGRYQKAIKKIPKLADRNMKKWRKIANEFIDTSPSPNSPIALGDFVDAWRERIPRGHKTWPETASLIELAYKLITWIDDLQNDVEGLVYLEAITQTIIQTGFFNDFSAKIHFNEKDSEKKSVEEAIWNIFIPIATGGVSINEDLLETLPNNRVNIMSIHQSKGLEFPLVVVDVGTRFKKNKSKTSFLRFPKNGEKSSNLEDTVRNHSPLGKTKRSKEDRAFDDLTRLYFVAFSRAQDVLLLIGLDSAIDGYVVGDELKKIPNIALGWKRDETFMGFDEIVLV